MRIFVTGGTGLVGRRLIPRLVERGDRVILLSRRSMPPANSETVTGDPSVAGPWLEHLADCDAVIHLAGEPILARRWRSKFRKKLFDSRVLSTQLIAETLAKQPLRSDGSPKVLVSASATGYYGAHDNEDLDENDPPGDGFLADICKAWEKPPPNLLSLLVCA